MSPISSRRPIPYAHQWVDREDIEEVVKVLRSDWLTQGPRIKKFEDLLCQYTGARYAVAVSSGTAGLHIACLAAGMGKGDEAITSSITFVASANCAIYCGGRPVFADIQKDTINIDPKEIEKKINKKTAAIIPVHFAGHPCDLEEIRAIAKRHKLFVIEDAAHALGAEYKGERIGSCKYSDMTVFSFHPVKHITTGEGGAVLTNRRGLYEKLLMLRNHGITRDRRRLLAKDKGPWYYEMRLLGFNYRITDFQCALGISQLKKINRFLKRRREIADIYDSGLSGIDGLELPCERDYVSSGWHIYVIRVRGRAKRRMVYEAMSRSGITPSVHYRPVYLNPYYADMGYRKGTCPKAEEYYSQALTIPLYPRMSDREVLYVVKRVKEALE